MKNYKSNLNAGKVILLDIIWCLTLRPPWIISTRSKCTVNNHFSWTIALCLGRLCFRFILSSVIFDSPHCSAIFGPLLICSRFLRLSIVHLAYLNSLSLLLPPPPGLPQPQSSSRSAAHQLRIYWKTQFPANIIPLKKIWVWSLSHWLGLISVPRTLKESSQPTVQA